MAATSVDDVFTHMRLPTLVPGWLSSGPDLYVTLFAVVVTLACFAYLAILISLYLSDRITYSTYERRAEVLSFVMAVSWMVILWGALGPGRTAVIGLPVVLLVLVARYAGRTMSDEIQASEYDRKQQYWDYGYVEYKSKYAPKPEPVASQQKMFGSTLFKEFRDHAALLLSAVYLAGTVACDQTGWIVLLSTFAAYYLFSTQKDRYVGAEGKWRKNLDPYVGFLLPEADGSPPTGAMAAEGARRSTWRRKSKWVLHGLMHYGALFYIQQTVRTYCKARI